MRKINIATLTAVLFLGMAASAGSVSLQLQNGAFKVTGWAAPRAEPVKGWSSILAVYTGVGDVPPMSGNYGVENGFLVFHPSFPLAPGVRYRVVFHAPGSAAVERAFDGPRREVTPLARVEQIYPSGDILPSNELRLYVYFSSPMSRGEAERHMRVLDENGKLLAGIFLPGEELWDPNFVRLTMTFDPGRIKRGLAANLAIGPPIVEGKRYTLVIDRDWPDARGVPMVEGFRKSFRGGPSERNPPDPKQWKITAPRAISSEALVVSFPAPMNYPLLQRMLRVSGARGEIAGTVNVGTQETEWRFTPQAPWKAGTYQLVVDNGLEDLAGNHIGQAFDVDVFEHVTERITSSTVSLPFVVR